VSVKGSGLRVCLNFHDRAKGSKFCSGQGKKRRYPYGRRPESFRDFNLSAVGVSQEAQRGEKRASQKSQILGWRTISYVADFNPTRYMNADGFTELV